MTLPIQPPKYLRWSDLVASIRKGEKGWRVWALQTAVNDAPAISCVADGDFGPNTEKAVKDYQRNHFVTTDGIAGPTTQGLLLKEADTAIHQKLPKLPDGILSGFAIAEGASVLAATNWYTPPGQPSGVDCGPVQWRQLGPPFSQDGLKKAFNPRTAFEYAGSQFLQRMDDYKKLGPMLSSAMILRLAVFAHNWPAGAEYYAKHGKLPNPTALAGWTSKPDGSGPYTQQEWFEEYPNRILIHLK